MAIHRGATPSSPAFEAASIKPSQPGDRSVINRSAGGRFTADKATLKILVKWAYELTDDELAGGPKWGRILTGTTSSPHRNRMPETNKSPETGKSG